MDNVKYSHFTFHISHLTLALATLFSNFPPIYLVVSNYISIFAVDN